MTLLDRTLESVGVDRQPRLHLGYLLDRGVYEQSVDGTSADFQVETFREYRRIRTLMDENDVIEDVLAAVSADDVFYDVGANVGVYTCLVGQELERVVAFEPHGETAARLRDNVALNDVRADVYEYALADDTGTATLSLPGRTPKELGTGEFSLAAVEEPTTSEEADVIPGDALVEREDVPMPTVAKVDVEGAELATLDGFSETLAECRVLYVEVHRDHVALDDVRERLRRLGFRDEILKERGNTTFLKTTPTGRSQ